MKYGFTAAGELLWSRLAQQIERHPKRVTALVAALLLGGGGGAFAVASIAPDAADLPVRQITEQIPTPSLQAQVEALDVHQFNLFRSDTVRATDSIDTLMQRLGLSDPTAAAFLRNDPLVRISLLGRTGRQVSAEATDDHRLLRLTARWAPDDSNTFQRLVFEKTPQGRYTSRIETGQLSASSKLAGGTIRSSLFAATDDAGIPDQVATQLAEIFSGDIDFHRSLRKDDRFSVVYETLEADGEPLRTGRVLSAEFINAGKTYQAMWFQEPGQKGGYYTLDGNSLRRAFLTSPVEFSRVTSGFKMRFHPILQTWRAHLGTDYAAPVGTAVRSVGDGVVDFAGVQNGYGNVVIVKHRNNQTTVYAHLSRISVVRGQTISQGQNLGAVGATGWATGPHLHFEFRVNGVHQDPMTIARQSESIPVSTAARPAFNRLASAMRIQLSAAASVQQASAD
ncbi:M23 family metallopeptidase [Curvibacter sp. HBC61]|uniref:M23 family metallopeptidase n=1 Tax=Curvibacter cyanobacteriorum TaxID=3026422 RepID=A0ABT5N3X9_9BURK|nr:M23 family metallopeptidase [Curvibacter sp. HBC61]MDD0840970.1 M23 family metallopeptidase [Curvibacter sp. HBC61]